MPDTVLQLSWEGASAVSKPCSVTQWYTNSCQFSEGLFINREKNISILHQGVHQSSTLQTWCFVLCCHDMRGITLPAHFWTKTLAGLHLSDPRGWKNRRWLSPENDGRGWNWWNPWFQEPMEWNWPCEVWNQPDAIFTSLALYELPGFLAKSLKLSEKKSCTVKHVWNRPAIYVAANQFHHKHEDMFVCDMFDVVDMDIEFASVSQEAFPVCATKSGRISSQPTERSSNIFPKIYQEKPGPNCQLVCCMVQLLRGERSVRLCFDLRQCSSEVFFFSYCPPISQRRNWRLRLDKDSLWFTLTLLGR